jgi:hypothetical protein
VELTLLTFSCCHSSSQLSHRIEAQSSCLCMRFEPPLSSL